MLQQHIPDTAAARLPARPLALPGRLADIGGLEQRPQRRGLERRPHAPRARHGPALRLRARRAAQAARRHPRAGTTLGGQPKSGGSNLLNRCNGSPHVGADTTRAGYRSAASWQGMRVRGRPPPCPYKLLAAGGNSGALPACPCAACARPHTEHCCMPARLAVRTGGHLRSGGRGASRFGRHQAQRAQQDVQPRGRLCLAGEVGAHAVPQLQQRPRGPRQVFGRRAARRLRRGGAAAARLVGAARHTAVSLLTRVCAGPVLQFVCAGRYDTR